MVKVDGFKMAHSDGDMDGDEIAEVYRHVDKHLDGYVDGKVDGRGDGYADGDTNGQKDGRKDGHADDQVDGHSEGQIDGHAEGSAFGPGGGYSGQDGLRLPLDIISLIARTLENDKSAETLAQVNVTCRIVHLETLPILYECMTLETEKHFSKIVGFSNPKGWMFVKYLNLSELTLALLHQHQRFISLYQQHFEETTDLLSPFPKLVYVRVSTPSTPKFNESTTPMRVELYKAIEVEALACLASPSRWIFDHINSRLVSIPPCTTQLLDDLTTLVIKKGGCLLPLEGALPTEDQWPAPLAEADCTLSLVFEEEHGDEDQTRTTMGAVLDMLDHATAEHNRYETFKEMFQDEAEEKEVLWFQLKCYPSAFDTFIKAFQDKQPFFLPLRIDILERQVSAVDMQRYITTLAECYATGWDTTQNIEQCDFAMITAVTPLSARFSRQGKDSSKRQGLLRGFLLGGQDPYMEPRPAQAQMQSGFSCTVVEGWSRAMPDRDVNIEETGTLYERNYPCNTVSVGI